MPKTTTQLVIEGIVGAILGSAAAYAVFTAGAAGDAKAKKAQEAEIERIVEEKISSQAKKTE